MDPVTFAILGTVFGGCLLKAIESFMSHGKVRAEEKVLAIEAAAKTIYDCPRYDQRIWELKLSEAGIFARDDVAMCEEDWCVFCSEDKAKIKAIEVAREKRIKAEGNAKARANLYASVYSEPYTKPRRRNKYNIDYWENEREVREFEKYVLQLKKDFRSDHLASKAIVAVPQAQGQDKPVQEVTFLPIPASIAASIGRRQHQASSAPTVCPTTTWI
jgi:hypothetical protein